MNLKIKELLSSQGKTAVWLSKEIGITDVNTRNIINGVINPKLDTLEKISIALGVPMWQLFASPDEVQPQQGTASLTCPHCGKPINIKAE